MVETSDAGQRKPTSGAGQRTADASSQQVDDVGEEDEANDGEEHQHQNVHHDGDAAGGDGRRGHAGGKKKPTHSSRAAERSAKIGRVRAMTRRGGSAPLLPSPPPRAARKQEVVKYNRISNGF